MEGLISFILVTDYVTLRFSISDCRTGQDLILAVLISPAVI